MYVCMFKGGLCICSNGFLSATLCLRCVMIGLYLLECTGWRTKCHTIDCTHNTFLFLQKHLTSGTELILIGWKIVSNESV